MIEHKSVLDCCAKLADSGVSVTYLQPQRDGIVSLDTLFQAIRPDTRLVSIMTANNETGTLQKWQKLAHSAGIRAFYFIPMPHRRSGKSL